MNVNVSIGGGQKMALTGAVLVYRGGIDVFAVWHSAKPGPEGGAPYLGEAESLTTEFLRTLAAGLGTYIPPEILPANVLVRTSELLVWWTPAQYRTLFFGEQSEAGKDLSGKRYPVPPGVQGVGRKSMGPRPGEERAAECDREAEDCSVLERK